MRKAQPIAKTSNKQPVEEPPRQIFVPRPKKPWLLGLCVVLLVVWLIFLAYLAYRG